MVWPSICFVLDILLGVYCSCTCWKCFVSDQCFLRTALVFICLIYYCCYSCCLFPAHVSYPQISVVFMYLLQLDWIALIGHWIHSLCYFFITEPLNMMLQLQNEPSLISFLIEASIPETESEMLNCLQKTKLLSKLYFH